MQDHQAPQKSASMDEASKLQRISEANVNKTRLMLLLALLLPASFLAAQEFTGHVTDATGAVIPKATIVARNLETNVNTTTVSTGAGDYTIPLLNPGPYTVTAQATGFEKELRTGIVLQINQTAVVNFSLPVGRATESVTVQGDALLDVGKADIGEVVENERVTELPINGRDPGMLSILNAGALWNQWIGYQRPFDDTQANLSVNGGGGGNTALMLDGVSNEATSTNNTGNAKIAYVAPIDSVQEFKIITNPYDAQFGRMAGGVEDVVLKAGTNKIHGDVYEYARRTWMDADTWQNDWNIARLTTSTPASRKPYSAEANKRDQYGAELDGPISLPKLYNGRNRSFFTLQYEDWNEVEPNTVTDSVPGSGWVTGDFSNLTYWGGATAGYLPLLNKDPENISYNATTGVYTRVPFGPTDSPNQGVVTILPSAGKANVQPTAVANTLPASRINSFGQKMMQLYPAANTVPSVGSNPFASNYTAPGSDTDRYRNILGKVDENISAKDRFSLHYGYWERVEKRSYDGFTGPEQQGQLPHGERSHTFTTEETHTFTPNLLFDFRANVTARADYSYNGPGGFDPTTLGWSAAEVAMLGTSAASEFPLFSISEFAGMGNNNSSQTVSDSLVMFPTITWVKGKHTLHGGIDLRFQQSVNDRIGGGTSWWVDRTWTQTNCGSCGSWDQASGNSISAVLLGNATSGSDSINTKTYWSQHYYAPFLQDDWKFNHRLTLNLGVRWDFMPGETERNNEGMYAFDTVDTNPINSLVTVPGYSKIIGGPTYGLKKTNIQPRVGFAYALNDKTVLRGGFGETMKSPQNAPNNAGFSANTNAVTADPGLPGSIYPNLVNTETNPFSSIVLPTGSSLGMTEQLGQGPWFLNKSYFEPSFWSYSMGFERQFLKHDTVNVSYVGTRLFNGDNSDNINRVPSSNYVPCNPQMGGRNEVCSNNNVTNPFKGINGFQGSSDYTSSTINGLTYTTPFPEFGGITVWQTNESNTWYNSLQVTAMHKWSNSLSLHGTWTWSKLMDSGGWTDQTYRVPYRGLDGSDDPHRITVSGVYLLPVGRGRSFLPNANRIVDGAIGGWEVESLFVYQTGSPVGVPNNELHNGYVKPHIQKDDGFIRLMAACVNQYVENNGVYSLAPLVYDYDGTCAQSDYQINPNYGETTNTVYSGIRNPRHEQFDAAISKNFSLVERMKLQIRMEAFNALNHPLWGGPDTNQKDTTFGLTERGPWGQANLPRQTELSAKIVW
jgi:hypothetical protein